FDYLIPEELVDRVEVGTRVKVPFGPRSVLGVVTALADESPHTNLRPIERVIGARSLVTPRVLDLARWIAAYYCCPVELALKSVLPEAVRREQAGWRERLFVRTIPPSGGLPKLTRRQTEVWNVIEELREVPLQELVRITGSTSETVRRLEDKGLVQIAPRITERDPYGEEHIVPSQPLPLNPEQAVALEAILGSLNPG
ncbi:MAG: primosomal protein N', partial [Verrucomicrobiae bacterium]|nr:primosomal protein N' [Verrucomicrobiae bacterium]